MANFNRTRYIIIKDSDTVADDFGTPYPDIFTFPINEFVNQDPIAQRTMSDDDVYRMDHTMLSTYGRVDYYDEMTLWLNGLFELVDTYIGTKLGLYSKRDLDRLVRDNIIVREGS